MKNEGVKVFKLVPDLEISVGDVIEDHVGNAAVVVYTDEYAATVIQTLDAKLLRIYAEQIKKITDEARIELARTRAREIWTRKGWKRSMFQ